MSEYYTVLTNLGAQKVAAAITGGPALELTDLVVGDGGGGNFYENHDRESLKSRSGLVNQRWSGPLYLVDKDPQNPAWAITEGQVPVDVGGWYIREVGIKDSAGDLIAIGVYPETYKPVLAAQIGADLTLRSIIEVGDANTVTLKIDPSVVQATREWVHQHKVDKTQIGSDGDLLPTVNDLEKGIGRDHYKFSFAKDIDQGVSGHQYLLLTRVNQQHDGLIGNIYGRRGSSSGVGYGTVCVFIKLTRGNSARWSVECWGSQSAYLYSRARLVLISHNDEEWIALRAPETGAGATLSQACFIGHSRSKSEKQLRWVIPNEVVNQREIDKLPQVENRFFGRPGDQIGNNTAWHSGNTIVDADGFIKGA